MNRLSLSIWAMVLFAMSHTNMFGEKTSHAFNLYWGERFGYFVPFNVIQYESPDLVHGLPLGIDADLRMDETFYLFTFSSYSLSAVVRYRIGLGPEWYVRTAVGYFVSMSPFYSGDTNWIYSAPLAEIGGGWNGGVFSLELKNRFGFYIDGFETISGLVFAWRFHERFRLLVSSDFIAAVLYRFSRAETAIDCRLGIGVLL